MGLRNASDEIALFTAAVVNGYSAAKLVRDYEHIVYCVATTGTATATIKFQGSFSEAKPDFTAAATPTNRWTFINVRDYLDNSAIAWGTGVVVAGTDIVKMVELNTNGMNWVCVQISNYSAGSVTVTETGFSNV